MLITFTLPYFQVHGIMAPAYNVLGTHATPTNLAIWARQNGMDHPYLVRFWTYFTQVLFHFNLGHSYKLNLSVWGIIKLYVPRTIWLALASLILTILIAIPLGIFQASKRNTVFDYAATGVGVRALRDAVVPAVHAGPGRLQLPLAAPAQLAAVRASHRGRCSPTRRGSSCPWRA